MEWLGILFFKDSAPWWKLYEGLLHNASWIDLGGGVTVCASVHFQTIHISHYVTCESVLSVASRCAGVLYHWQVTRSLWDPANLNVWIVQGWQMLSQMWNVQKEEGIDNFSLWNEVELSLSLDQKGHWKAELKGISSIVLRAVLHPCMHRISTDYFALCYIKYELE